MSQTSPCSEKKSVLEGKSPRRGSVSSDGAVSRTNSGL